jgi:hypothetical protein
VSEEITVEQMASLPQNVVDGLIALERERNEWRGLYEHGLEDRNALLARIVTIEEQFGRAKNILQNIADADPEWSVPVKNFLDRVTSAETKAEHVHRWTSKKPDAFCEDCLAERYPTENPPDA